MPTVLIVDDNPVGIESLADVLEDYDLHATGANSGEEALELLEQMPEAPDCIILDTVLPGMDGLELCERLKKNSATAGIPVIFLTGSRNDATIVQALDIGAADFLAKPVRIPELIARIQAALRDKALHEAAMGGYVIERALLDGRRALVDRLKEELRRAVQLRRPVTCLMFEAQLPQGASSGLSVVAEQSIQGRLLSELEGCWRENDICARLAGLRCALVVFSYAERGGTALAERIQNRLTQAPVAVEGGAVQVVLSAGIAQAPLGEPVDAEELVARAEAALEQALAGGRRIVVWTPQR